MQLIRETDSNTVRIKHFDRNTLERWTIVIKTNSKKNSILIATITREMRSIMCSFIILNYGFIELMFLMHGDEK